MIVNPSVTKPKGTPGSTRGRQANHQRCYTVAEINSAEGAILYHFIAHLHESVDVGRVSTIAHLKRYRKFTLEGIYKVKKPLRTNVRRVSRRRSSIHIAPETNEESGIQEGMGGCSRGVNRRRSSIHIPPEKAERRSVFVLRVILHLVASV
jgi:hypothetical protein